MTGDDRVAISFDVTGTNHAQVHAAAERVAESYFGEVAFVLRLRVEPRVREWSDEVPLLWEAHVEAIPAPDGPVVVRNAHGTSVVRPT